MVKLGVIGLGHMGGYHASVCSMSPLVELVGVADVHPQNLAKVTAHGVAKAADYREWIDGVDGVIIAVPTALHHTIAKDCLERGKHVLLEKPLTKELWQATELFALAKQMDKALHVGHVERFNGAVQELKNVVDRPYVVECHRMGPFTPRVQHDSVVLDLMIHDLDLVLSIANSPVKQIHAQGHTVFSSTCDIATAQLVFENGMVALLTSSRAAQIKKRTMSISQRDAFIQLDFTTQDITIHRRASSSVQVSTNELRYKQEATIEHVFVYKDNPLKLEVEHFARAIKQHAHLSNPNQDIQALQITLEIEKLLGLK